MRQTQDQRDRNRKLAETGAVSPEELVRTEEAHLTARAQLSVAQANLAPLKAGAWEPDKAIAAANVDLARSQVEQSIPTKDAFASEGFLWGNWSMCLSTPRWIARRNSPRMVGID